MSDNIAKSFRGLLFDSHCIALLLMSIATANCRVVHEMSQFH